MEDKWQSYDSLLDSDPEIQARKAKAAAQASVQATVQAKQETMLLVVQTRFPDLVELAKQRTVGLTANQLDLIIQWIVIVPNENMARFALGDVAT